MRYTPEQRQKLKAHYDSLIRQSEIVGKMGSNVVDAFEWYPVDEEIQSASTDFPDLMPAFRKEALIFPTGSRERYYSRGGLQNYLAAALGRLRAALEENQGATVAEALEFLFIKDRGLQEILERDYLEIQTAYATRCWKSAIILCGGSIEAILLDRMLKDEAGAKAAKTAPSGKSDLSRWDLAELIKVAVELKYVEPIVETLAGPVRQYRNLVHPGNELRNKLTVSELEANSAFNVLNIVHRDFSK